MAAVPGSLVPSKTVTCITPIPQFPENPKSIILQKCCTRRDLNQIHAHLIKTRLIFNPSLTENLLESAAIILPNAMDYALSIFGKIDEPKSFAYNVMIRYLTYQQSPDEALLLFKQMCASAVLPDEFTFSSVFKACSKIKGLVEASARIRGMWARIRIGYVSDTDTVLIRR